MKTKIISAQEVRTQEVRTVEISTLPIGKYKGTWGGYEVTAEIEGVKYQFKTEKGIRTQSTPVLLQFRMVKQPWKRTKIICHEQQVFSRYFRATG